MRLHELTADAILEVLEERGEASARARHEAKHMEAIHDRVKASTFIALRKAGSGSVDDCKAAVLNSETVIEAFNNYLAAELESDRAYLALERARTAAEMWRSEQANRRKV